MVVNSVLLPFECVIRESLSHAYVGGTLSPSPTNPDEHRSPSLFFHSHLFSDCRYSAPQQGLSRVLKQLSGCSAPATASPPDSDPASSPFPASHHTVTYIMATATAASFRPVNLNPPSTASTAGESNINSKISGESTPTTPRPSGRFSGLDHASKSPEPLNPITPNRHDFGGIPGQRALPNTPFSPSNMCDSSAQDNQSINRGDSTRSAHSHLSEGDEDQDVEMGDDNDEEEDSDNESTTSDTQRPRKKKKGQRFYCTDFPPCGLSFTRSEHLARHIRKHTGERPFQCHCSRRFSRLDNLRQHAQTVHVNEEIPGDSLAATGTRFQRQIRTDRVRPQTGRSRASTTTGSAGLGHSYSHGRGHSRNLSASSIGSTTSNVSSLPEESSRRRPAPLAIAAPGASPTKSQQYGYYQPQSPPGYGTPTSATFSTGQPSPRFGVQSPTALSRNTFYNGTRPAARRLSVPSAPVYQLGHPYANYAPPVYYTSGHPANPPPGYSNTSSMVASPTGSVFSHGRRESEAELDWRRRTWHPGTHSNYVQRPATSGLTYQQTPDDTKPTMAAQSAASQITRLPGIESFDHVPPLPGAPGASLERRLSSPMQVDGASRPPVYPGPVESSAMGPSDHRRSSSVWEAGLHQNLNRLDIANTPPKHSVSYMDHASLSGPPTTDRQFAPPPPPPNFSHPHLGGPPRSAMPSEADNRGLRRQGWYGGPAPAQLPQGSQPIMIAQRTSPAESAISSDGVPTPGTSLGTELHPAILHPNGMVEMQPPGSVLSEEQHRALQAHANAKPEPPMRADSGSHLYAHIPGQTQPTYMLHTGHEPHPYSGYPPATRAANDTNRLDALAAIATSETAQSRS